MRKCSILVIGVVGALALSACGKTAEAPAAADQSAAAAQAPPRGGAMAMGGGAASPPTASGAGVVSAVDKAAGTVTIDHGPIPAIGWPAMKMGFPAADPALLDQVKVGDKVSFEFKTEGNQLTAIRKE